MSFAHPFLDPGLTLEQRIDDLISRLTVTEKIGQLLHENRAIEVLEDAFKRTTQFRFRKAVGEIKISQLGRMERTLRQALQKDPGDADLKKQYAQFLREKTEEELAVIQEMAAEYGADAVVC